MEVKPETLAEKMFEIGRTAANRSLVKAGQTFRMMRWGDLHTHVKDGHIAIAKYHLAQMARRK
jgi:ribosomal 50S subunit-recycling heat shock protein